MIKYTNFDKKISYIILGIVIMLFILYAVISSNAPETVVPNTKIGGEEVTEQLSIPADIIFNIQSGFYEQKIEVELTNNTKYKNAEIRYTTNGSIPTAKSTVYKGAIKKNAADEAQAFTIRAAVFDKDKLVSSVITNTYICGRNIGSQFDIPIICLSTDEANLWDDEIGIFADGMLRKNAIKANNGRPVDFTAPANWWMHGIEWERPAYIEFFDPNGNRVVAQEGGMRIHGGWSRGNDRQRSIRIFARTEYDEINNKFRYDIFPMLTSDDDLNKRITSFKRLVLRNGGNDHWNSRIRDEVMQDIAGQSGLQKQASRAALIVLNGKFYGFTQIKQTYDKFTLQDNYNAPDDNFTLLENASNVGGYSVMHGLEQERKDLVTLVTKISSGLAKDEKGRIEIEKSLDVYQILHYYAVQIYIGNGDWPHNNYKLFKYNDPESVGYRAQLDGRWRFLLFDTDFGFGIYDGSNVDMLGKCIRDKGDNGLFAGLMRSDEYKAMFTRIMCDLINTYFIPANVNRTMGLRELEAAKNITIQHDQYGWDNEIQKMRNWVVDRPAAMYKQLSQYFKYEAVFNAVLSHDQKNGKVMINNFEITENEWNGYYYEDTFCSASAVANPGWKFDKWIVNNNTNVTDAVIFLDDYLIDGSISIKPVFVEDNDYPDEIVINEVFYRGVECDFVEIYNPSSKTVSLSGYFLSDDPQKPAKWVFGNDIIEPHSFYTVYFTKDGNVPKNAVVANFGLKTGETLTLSKLGVTIDSILLPDVKKTEGYGRYPDGGNFIYLQQRTPQKPNYVGPNEAYVFDYMKNRIIVRGKLFDESFAPLVKDKKMYVPVEVLENLGTGSLNDTRKNLIQKAVTMEGKKYVSWNDLANERLISVTYIKEINSVIISKRNT